MSFRTFRWSKKILALILFISLLGNAYFLPIAQAEDSISDGTEPPVSTENTQENSPDPSTATEENRDQTLTSRTEETADRSHEEAEEPSEPEETSEENEPIEPSEPGEPAEPVDQGDLAEDGPAEEATSEPLTTSGDLGGAITEENTNTVTDGAGTTTATTSTIILPTLEAQISASTTPSTSTTTATTTLPSPDTIVETGSAAASGSVVNVANTNTVGSGGAIMVLNQPATTGNIDTRSALGSGDPTTAVCTTCGDLLSTSIEGEIQKKLLIDGTNNATITNYLSVAAITGDNVIASSSDDAFIKTGDAYAAGNIINIVNSNFVGVDYLIFLLNNLGNLVGDIILPGQDFFTSLLAGLTSYSGKLSVDNDNMGTVTNSITANGETGENSTASGTPNLIVTGDVENYANVTNVVNKNIFGNFMYLFLRVTGDWNGEILGLPDGIEYARVNGGLLFYAEPNGSSLRGQTVEGLDIETETQIQNQNFANIVNALNLSALTGENSITGTDSARIETGDAKTVANIVNIANTNIVGDHWLLAMINILGDWNGDLSFGQPDLVVTERALSAGTPPSYDEQVRFIIDLANKGDAKASQVVVRWHYNQTGVIGGYVLPDGARERDGALWWDIGTLLPGEHKTLQFDARVIGRPTTNGKAIVEVTGYETDANTGNNYDVITFAYSSPTGGQMQSASQPTANNQNYQTQSGVSPTSASQVFSPASPESAIDNNSTTSISYGRGAPSLSIAKNHTALTNELVPTKIKYTVVISNTGTGSAYNTEVIDTMMDPTGRIIARQSWPIGTIHPNEDIILDYEMNFTSEAPAGIYRNEAILSGNDENGAPFSPIAAIATLGLSNPIRNVHESRATIATTTAEGITVSRSRVSENPLSGSIIGQTTATFEDSAWHDGQSANTVFADSPTYIERSRHLSPFALGTLSIALPAILFLSVRQILLARRREDTDQPIGEERWEH